MIAANLELLIVHHRDELFVTVTLNCKLDVF